MGWNPFKDIGNFLKAPGKIIKPALGVAAGILAYTNPVVGGIIALSGGVLSNYVGGELGSTLKTVSVGAAAGAAIGSVGTLLTGAKNLYNLAVNPYGTIKELGSQAVSATVRAGLDAGAGAVITGMKGVASIPTVPTTTGTVYNWLFGSQRVPGTEWSW